MNERPQPGIPVSRSTRLDRSLRWDSVAETFPDDAEARKALDPRPFRGDWRLPEA